MARISPAFCVRNIGRIRSSRAFIGKSLRQGVHRANARNALSIAGFLGTVDPTELKAAAVAVQKGEPLSDDHRAAIGRFELAADARISSALSRAQDVYLGTVRCFASAISIMLAEVASFLLGEGDAAHGLPNAWLMGLLVGIVAVPLAPIANDVVSALQAATKALRSR
jgi:hypothetical protein